MPDSKYFVPARGLAATHLQTCWGPFFRHLPVIEYREEKLSLADGDHVWLYWAGPVLTNAAPCVMLFHGLGGSRESHYIRGMQLALANAGITSVAMDARGAGGRPNDKAYCYHAGSIETIDALVVMLQETFPTSPLFGVGYSLGGTQLLNWLIQTESRELTACATVSPALWLKACCDKLDSRSFMNWRYRRYLLDGLLKDLEKKREHLLATDPDESQRLVMLDPFENIHSFYEFDEYINAPLHHFAGAEDYYERCTPGNRLEKIEVPTLMIIAKDDPFMQRSKQPDSGKSGNVTIEASGRGGHVGFVSGSIAKPVYWTEPRIINWFAGFGLASLSQQAS